MVRTFTLEYWIDADWHVGRLREVPGVFSQGKTLQDLMENVSDAYRLMMAEDEDVLPSSEVKTIELELEV